MCRNRNVLCEKRHESVYGNSVVVVVVELSLVFVPVDKTVPSSY